MTKILDGFNPCSTNMDPTGDPRLQSFFLDRHPGHAQRVVWLSRADCSTMEPETLKSEEGCLFGNTTPIWKRIAADRLLASFCPIKTVCKLVERGVPRDFDGFVVFDHEIPAWMSCLHRAAYRDLRHAILGAFPDAKIREYAGVRTDFVMEWNKNEDRSHELKAMDRLSVQVAPLIAMLSLYVPGWEYIKDLGRFKEIVHRNVNRSALMEVDAIAINHFIEGTQKDPNDYTSGDLVPVEAMTIIVKAIIDAGAAVCIWGAAYNERQGNRFVEAVEQVVIPAVEKAEASK